MFDYREFFREKKVTLMGLGLLGRGVGDAEFLAKMGVDLLVTDLKKEKDLHTSLLRLKGFSNIQYVLGEHRLEDFSGKDFILKAAGVPIDSPFIAEAKKKGIPVEMDASLFLKLAPRGVMSIGITGTRGKSTVTHLIYAILKEAGKNVFLGGNVKDTATLPLLSEMRSGDYIVLELDSWQLQGFGESKISPHVSVFTNFMYDHMNYYGSGGRRVDEAMELYWKDKANIFAYQKSEDILVLGPSLAENLKIETKAKIVRADKVSVPKVWQTNLLGEHNLENISCALSVARVLGVDDTVVEQAILKFKPVSGRLELIKEVRGIKIYNDTNATTPDATLAGLRALTKVAPESKNIILIMGGADKNLDMSKLAEAIPHYCKEVFLLSGTGSEKFKNYKVTVQEMGSLKEAVLLAIEKGEEGDIILFSPAFASFGMFKNEYDRGEQFVKIVSSL